MSPTPLAYRMVEVIADLGEGQRRYGSGCIVSGRTVLTAAHVVAGAVSIQVRDTKKVEHEATLDPRFVGDADGPGPDLALVEINDSDFDVSPMALAAVDRDSPTGDSVERCHAIGYPTFMEYETPDGDLIRDTVDACGHVSLLSGLIGGLLSVQVSSTPKDLPPEELALGDSQWSGISGGPLVADGNVLGVVTEHAQRQGPSMITATPLTALEADPACPERKPGVTDPGAWWKRLGISGVGDLRRLPAQPERERPAYRDTVREIRGRTSPLLGRHLELAEITAFATGPGGYRWLVGGAWAGKTSLLAEAVTTTLPEQVDVVSYFLSRRESDADSAGFLGAVVPQLAYLCDVENPAAEVSRFRALWERAAERAASQDRELLLVVDGLDEDLRPPALLSVAALLPSAVGGRAHVLVGSRPYPELPSDIPVGHSLKVTRPLELEPFAGAQELADLAGQEIDDLMRRDRDDDGLAADVLGLLTAAAGPLAVEDLATMTVVAPRSAALRRRIRHLITDEAARVLQPVGPADSRRYQFAHGSLLENAQGNDDLNDPDFRHRIHRWAQTWHEAGWPPAVDNDEGTPIYLLDAYPSTLAGDPEPLAALVSSPGWVVAAVLSVGVDSVLTDLRRATAADPTNAAVSAILATVRGQAHHLRASEASLDTGFVLRQLCLEAAELGEAVLASALGDRLRGLAHPGLVPLWTSRRIDRALVAEVGGLGGSVLAVAGATDGRVVIGGDDRWVRVWNPATPETPPVELGRHHGAVRAVAVGDGGQVVSGGDDWRVLIWNLGTPAGKPFELGRHGGAVRTVTALLPAGQVLSGGADGRVFVWASGTPGGEPVELGRHSGAVRMVAMGADGQVVTGGADGRVLVWEMAKPGAGSVELARHLGTVRTVAVGLDGKVVSGGADGRVWRWDHATSGTKPVELGRHGGAVRTVAVSPGGHVFSGGDDGWVRVWDPAQPGAGCVELGRHRGTVRTVVVARDGTVVSGGDDGWVRVWDPTAMGSRFGSRHDDGEVTAVAVMPGQGAVSGCADALAVTGGADGRVRVWNSDAPETQPVELGRHKDRVTAVAVAEAEHGCRVLTTGHDGRVLKWDPAAPGNPPVEIGRHPGAVLAVATNGRVVTGGFDGWVRVWTPATPRSDPVDLGCHDGCTVTAVAVLPNGPVISGGTEGTIRVWDRDKPARLDCGTVNAMAVLDGGQVIFGGDDGMVRVWDPAKPDNASVDLGRHDGWVNALGVLPGGLAVSGGTDGRVRIWDVSKREALGTVACSVQNLATGVSTSGQGILLVAHADRGISMWSHLP